MEARISCTADGMEICDEECPAYEKGYGFYPTTKEARDLLRQRCIDAGWSKKQATTYVNRMLPDYSHAKA
jgi:hypothetical protein